MFEKERCGKNRVNKIIIITGIIVHNIIYIIILL